MTCYNLTVFQNFGLDTSSYEKYYLRLSAMYNQFPYNWTLSRPHLDAFLQTRKTMSSLRAKWLDMRQMLRCRW